MDANQMLLGILAARAGLPAGLPAEEVLARLSETRPELALFRQLLEQREAAATAEPDEDDWDLIEDDDAARGDVVEALRSVLDMLARALGACSACWGRDPSCAECTGQGVPGFMSPHPDLFRELVLPAARRWQADLRASDRFHRGSGHHPDERN
jgi:hypothetical protein